MIDRTPETKTRTTQIVDPRDGLSREYTGPASRFHDELNAIVRSAADETNLRQLCLDCVLRYRQLIGVGWYRPDGDTMASVDLRFDNPALQHKPLQQWIATTCCSASTNRRDVVVRSSEVRNLALIALPFRRDIKAPEVLAVLVANPDDAKIEQETLAGRSIVQTVAEWSRLRELIGKDQQLRTTAALLELCGQLEATRDQTEASHVLVERLQEYLGCELVAVGLCAPGKKTTRLSALSGMAEVDHNSTRVRQVKAVIDESIVRNMPTQWISEDENTEHQMIAHKKLSRSAAFGVVLSTPLKNSNGDIVGGLVIAGDGALNNSATQGIVQTIELPIGNALDCVRRGQRGFLRRSVRRMLGANAAGKAIAAFAIVVVAALVMLIPVPYRIPCRFVAEPLERRFCVAPYDGLLEETLVEPGDVVVPGQVLATMDDGEMRFELAGLSAERHRAGKQQDVHRANENIADSLMAALDADRIGSRAELLNHRLQNLKLESQVNGVVLAGSSERRENYPVKTGQMLFEIAPLEELLLEVSIAADEIDHAQPGMEVELRLDSHPADVHTGRIKRIRPRSEIVDDQNVFVAEVVFQNLDHKLRPGMEGTARIVSESHPIGWNLFHRAYEYVSVNWLW